MTPDEFWTEFRKVASRFSVGENGLIRSEEMRCPICEVAFEKTGNASEEDYLSDRIRIRMDIEFATTVADAADYVVTRPLQTHLTECRTKMLAIMQEAQA